jgi:hypothetical protein
VLLAVVGATIFWSRVIGPGKELARAPSLGPAADEDGTFATAANANSPDDRSVVGPGAFSPSLRAGANDCFDGSPGPMLRA